MNRAAARGRFVAGAIIVVLALAACGPTQPSPTSSAVSSTPSGDLITIQQ